jgi:hypothetical protein
MDNKKTVTAVSIASILALGVGFAVGSYVKGKSCGAKDPVSAENANLENESLEALSAKLSRIMLPEEEFSKFNTAIYQTAMGLFMTQAQQAGVQVSESAQQELKKAVDEKYSRDYFAGLNAKSMQALTKEHIAAIIRFYGTEAGKIFLTASPTIIQETMTTVQTDLTQWLPKTVEALVMKLKGGAPQDDKKGEPGKGEEEANPNAEAKPNG